MYQAQRLVVIASGVVLADYVIVQLQSLRHYLSFAEVIHT